MKDYRYSSYNAVRECEVRSPAWGVGSKDRQLWKQHLTLEVS